MLIEREIYGNVIRQIADDMARSGSKNGKIGLHGVTVDNMKNVAGFFFDFIHNGNAALVHFNDG